MNLAIIGCGAMGNHHAQMAANCGVNIVACADKFRKAATALAKKHKAKATTDFEAVIKRDDVDIVLITTPTPTHLGLIKAAAKAKKHIFCEKPMALTVAQCKQAIAAAEKAGVKLFVGHVVRYFHEFEAMKAQAKSGKIGKVGYVKLYRGGLFPTSSPWFSDPEQSGGVTLDTMIHDLDWLRYAFGEPTRIFCQALTYKKLDHIDYSQVTVRMKNGIIAKLIGTWAHPDGFKVQTEICGSEGMIQFDSTDLVISGQKRDKGVGPGMVIPMSADEVSPFQVEWEDFLGWVEGGKKPKVTPQDGMRAVEMARAALKSAKTNKPVAL